MKKTYNKRKNEHLLLIISLILIITIFLSIGYSAFSTDLKINGIFAVIKAQKDIRIDNINLVNTEGNALSNNEGYNLQNVYSHLTLPESNSSVTYDVVIKNLGNVEMGLLEITGLPNNLKYSINNYELKEPLCDDSDKSKCTLGSTTTLQIKVEYNENGFDESVLDYGLNLNFNFKRIYSITYKGISANNYPQTILEDETLNISFVDNIPSNVNVIGVTSFSYTTPNLIISNPIDNVLISGVVASKHYEKLEFDGSSYENTGIYLFNEENINKNFEISFELTNVASNQLGQATILNSMEEKSPYPGFVFRVQANGTQIEFNSPKIKNKAGISISTIQKVLIKRYNDIYYIQINDGNLEKLGSYTGTTFNVPLVIGASPDTNPIRYFKGTLNNINIEVTDQEFYTVIFDSNGGTGSMENQKIRKDDTVNLNINTIEHETRKFSEWNTKADGSGVSYKDGASIINLAEPNKSITLYAQWVDPIKYQIAFDSNGGTGTMETQEFEYGSSQNLNTNTFTKNNRSFVRWNTESDGSGTNYLDGESVKNLTKIENDTIRLYAIWAEEYYNHQEEQQFTGNNCIDTAINLYSEANKSKNYEISFEIVNNGTNSKQATLMNSMYEVEPWPGVLFRYVNGTNFEVDMNGGSGSYKKYYLVEETTKVTIKRTNGVIYVSTNDNEFTTAKNHSSITSFDIPVTFGCSLTAEKTQQRYYKGTLKNMKVILFE